jgi:hypothetical protein
MQFNSSGTGAISLEKTAEERRHDARRFVDTLAVRLRELENLAHSARRFSAFNADEYTEFKRLFLCFSDLADEFQLLSHLTEEALARFNRGGGEHWVQHKELDEYFRRLQVPMLYQVISTNLHLLRVWDDRLQSGEGLPFGARELFVETIRVIHYARMQLLRPRYVEVLDEEALQQADRAERLLRTLIAHAPRLFDFACGSTDASPFYVEDDDAALAGCIQDESPLPS